MRQRVHVAGWRAWAAVLALALCVSGPAPSARGQEPPDRTAEFNAAMQEGNQALAQRKFLAAVDAFKKANDIRKKQSPEALFAMSRAYFAMSAFKDAADRCTEALKFTGDDTRLQGQMRYMHGLSFVALALQKGSTGEFKVAEEDFRATLTLTDKIPVAGFQLGSLLMRQGRDQEGVAALEAYIPLGGNAPEVEEARRMIANPRRARENYAPEFSLVTLQGELLQLKDLHGKAVLLDFWGTWCPPCRASTPDIVKFYKKHANDPFVMVGIAVHDKDEPWKEYIKEHEMVWPQYFDTGARIARLFGITAYPTYLILDGDGVIRSRQLGWGPGTTGELEREIKRAMKPSGGAPNDKYSIFQF